MNRSTARPPCPLPAPGVYPNSCPLSRWMMPSNHLILCHPLLLLPSIFPSLRVFSNESAPPIRWPKDWSFSFNISPSNERPGLISFRMDWLDLLAVQGTLKSLLQHHSSNASFLRCSAFFIVQLSHPYMTPGKTIALTRRTFVDNNNIVLRFYWWVPTSLGGSLEAASSDWGERRSPYAASHHFPTYFIHTPLSRNSFKRCSVSW